MAKLLALDIATRTGWCVGDSPRSLEYGAIRLAAADEPEGRVFSKFRQWLEGAIEAHGVDYFFTEEPYIPQPRVRFQRAGDAATPGPGSIPIDIKVIKRLIGLRAIARMVASENRIMYEEFAPNKIAKHFTGFARFPGGRTEKKARMCDVAKLHGYDVGRDDDIADAIAIWHLGAASVGLPITGQLLASARLSER